MEHGGGAQAVVKLKALPVIVTTGTVWVSCLFVCLFVYLFFP